MTPEERMDLSRYMYRNSPSYEERASQKRSSVAQTDLNTCRNALYPGGKIHKIMDRTHWCAMGDILFQDGDDSIRFRMTALGTAGEASNRNVDVWFQMDNWRITGSPNWDKRFGIKGDCGSNCSVTGNRTDTLRNWREAPTGSNQWMTFSSPEGSLTGDKVANHTFDIEYTALEINKIEKVPFRCDSAHYVGKWQGCVFDDGQPVTYTFDSRPQWVEQTKHVWRAQNTPDDTEPSSAHKKYMPGSPKSKDPLTRLYTEDGKKNAANRRKSVSQCKKFYGADYATSAGYDRQCDEYPYASTKEGAVEGANKQSPNDGYRHFSVDPITKSHNKDAGDDLANFYRANRMLDGDKFYVHLVTPTGGDYGGPAKPSGVAAPVSYSQCPANSVVEAKQAETKAYPEALFNKYAETTRDGWTGGDSTYSVTLGDGRRLWLFSDTFLGPLNDNGTRPLTAPLINSTFVAQVGDNLTTITGPDKQAIMPQPASGHWYWLGDGLVTTIGGKEHLQVIFHEWYKYGPGAWEFKIKRSMVATFNTSDLTKPTSIQPLRSDTGIQWGSAVMSAEQSNDGYTYIYGVDSKAVNKGMRIARVKGTNIAQPEKWQYLNSSRGSWMYGETEGDTALTGISNEYSVTPFKGNFVVISQDSTDAFSGKVRLWFGCDPFGAFGHMDGNDEVFRMPEGGPVPFGDCVAAGKEEDGRCFSYNAHVHPSLASGSRWTMSYNVNNFDNSVASSGAHYRDPTIYRPRFVSFTLTAKSLREVRSKVTYETQPKQTRTACREQQRPVAGVLTNPCP
ncbi:NucA/NucB deoxyribonuclease domain-containing protein [Streptomyces kanamyceticus]|uniref:NucA/NucB deoxyribonuclease domain-containing protein n=1 Tax=Streptomyces kanamyceticus TaxID=1967 RepID=UPI0037DC72D1